MRKGIIKSLMLMVLCQFAADVYAMANGFYMGIMMGPATNSAPSLLATRRYAFPNCGPSAGCPTPDAYATFFPGTTIANPRSTQFAARIYLGNQFNRFAAFEMGGTFFSSIRYDARGVPVYGSTDQRVRDIDAVLKGILPLSCFSVFAKLGVAASYLTSGGTFNPSFRPAINVGLPPPFFQPAKLNVQSTYKFKFSPTYSIGAAFDFNQNWQADISYNALSVGNNIGTLTYYAIGFSYHFVDRYCGQFLCDD